MTANTVNGSGNGARSGAQTLILLAAPLNVAILRALAGGPRQQTELRQATGSPAQTTLRAQLKRLVEVGTLEQHRLDRFPGALEYELAASGRDLLFVLDLLEGWLRRAPGGPLSLGDSAARAAVKALAEGWSTTMLRALAAGPLSLTELDGLIASLSYPSLERRLAAMRLAGQVAARAGEGRGTPYAVTEWLRQSVAPLIAAARWERRHMPLTTAPIGALDAEAAFLLTLPSLRLPADLHGSCRLAFELPGGGRSRLAGVTVEVRAGAIVSCATELRGHPDAWALGSTGAWLEALVEHDPGRLQLGGACALAAALIEGMHERCRGAPLRESSRPLDVERSISDDGSN